MLIVSTIFDVVIMLAICVTILLVGIIPSRKLLQYFVRLPSILRFLGLTRRQRLVLKLLGTVVYADNEGHDSEMSLSKRYMESILKVNPKVGEDFMFISRGKYSSAKLCTELLECSQMAYGERLSLMSVFIQYSLCAC